MAQRMFLLTIDLDPAHPCVNLRIGLGRLVQACTAVSAYWQVWAERRRSRRALTELDDRLMRDIGISRSDAEWEASKRFWR
jgi:uncharacterized protein YjiS (DUF1127 family)